jgi:hypothetical protein
LDSSSPTVGGSSGSNSPSLNRWVFSFFLFISAPSNPHP